MTKDRFSGPLVKLSKCAANGVLLTTITFLGERQHIFDPGAEELLPARRQTPMVFCPPSSRPTIYRVTPARSAGPPT